MSHRWIIRPPDPTRSQALAERLSVSPVAAQVLLNRGLGEPEEARRFLTPDLRQLHDPFLFREMRRAAERLHAAVREREPILVHGDYDVDGTTGTAVLVRVLRLLGASVKAFLPERREDGYGMKAARIAAFADAGVRVIVAVDNGTTAFAAIEEATRHGIDVIVADHHEPAASPGDAGGVRLPKVHALLNPKVPGETYPFDGLCGCGVAFKLAWAVAQTASPGQRVTPAMRELLLDALSLVAIGTIGDVVPLKGENRTLVAFGLRALASTQSNGLKALLAIARVEGAPGPDDVAFRLVPRLNAAGRMGRAGMGLDLLLETDKVAAEAAARLLDDENRRRQAIERRIFEEALPRAEEALEAAGGRAVVLADPSWHLGVVGIVAARLVERFNRPAVVIALEGDRGRGSARSVPGIALHEALARCGEHLLGHGGHAAAAGLEIRADAVEAFRRRFGQVLAEATPGEQPGHAAPLLIDAALELRDCTHALVGKLSRLEPHGCGNVAPLFAARGIALAAPPRLVGRSADHLQLLVRQGDSVVKAIGFGLGARARALESDGAGGVDIVFRPIINRWQGSERVELEVRDLACGAERASG